MTRRFPRLGSRFTLARSVGLLLIVLGLLLLGLGGIGFLFTLLRLGPTLVGAIQNLDQPMAGFIFLLSLGILLIFPVVGLVGTILAGIGLLLRHLGTQPAMASSPS